MMNFLVILFLALDLRVLGFNYPTFVQEYSKDNRVEVYGVIDLDKCPKVIQPLCGTNGKEFLYFKNKCHFEAKNYELLTQGLIEFYKCPLKFCESACPKCSPVYKPVCAVQVRTGEKITFSNPCEVERRTCTTKKEWRIISHFECNSHHLSRFLKPTKSLLYNTDCPEFCPLEYEPICARFMTLEKEFSNSCELRVTICQTKQKWDIIRRGPCQTSDYNTVTEFYAIDHVCPRPCSREYKPVCAKLHNELKEFSNKCELQNAVCQGHHDWQIIKEGPCWQTRGSLQHNECPELCTEEYRPVCAEYKGQQRQFGNSCQLQKAICNSNIKWKVVKSGSCSTIDSCPKFCPRQYEPVCVKYKNEIREFSNKCLLEQWNCKSHKTWELLQMGPCASYSLNTITQTHSCPQFCFDEYKPVCAEFNNELKEFENICEMQKHICETNTNWQLLKEDHCPFISKLKNACTKSCTKEYKPICAKFKGQLREFANSCELERSSCETDTEWELVTKGPCPVNSIKEVQESSCANEALEPICATYNYKTKTFNNICQLGEEIKRTKNNWFILHKGICSSTTPAKTTSVATTSSPITPPQATSSPATSTAELHNTTTATPSTTLKSTKYLTTETTTAAYETTNLTTTNKPKTTAMEYTTHPAMESSTINNKTKEEVSETTYSTAKKCGGEDVVDSASSSSTANYDTTASFSDTNYPSGAEDHSNCSHSKENSTKTRTSYYAEYGRHEKSKEKYKENTNSKVILEGNKIELKTRGPGTSRRNLQKEESTNNTKSTSNSTKSEEVQKNDKDFLSYNYFEGKSLTKWIEDHIRALLKRIGNSQDTKQNESDDKNTYSSENEKPDSNENRKENTNFKEYPVPNTSSHQRANLTQSNESKETKTESKVYSNKAYDSQSQREDSQYNNKNLDSKCNGTYATSTVNQTLHQNEQVSKSSKENDRNKTANTNIFTTSDYKTMTNEKLTAIENESTIKYSVNKETDTHHEQNYNLTKSKKGEIYNGVVYKAPIYDAPTYNFIYTAPFNFHGLGPHNHNNSVANRTNPGAAAKSPFDIYHFLSSLPVTSGSFAKSNLMGVPTAADNENTAIAAYTHTDNNPSKLSPYPFKTVEDKILPQTHLTSPVAISPPNGHYLTALASLNRNFAPKIPNFLSVKKYDSNKNNEPKEHHINHPALEAYKSAMSTIPSLIPKDHNVLPEIAAQPAAGYHSPVPQQLTKSSAPFSLNHSNSPQISLNSTLLKQIVETLKLITNRYN